MVKIERVYFNGKELTQYITITSDFHLWQGADFSPQFSDDDILSGSEFYYTRFGKKVISVPFFNCTGSFEDYNQLLRTLNVKEPKELRFSSRPNIVFYAIPSGKMEYDKITRNAGKGAIEFIISDGLGHSTATRTFNFTKNDFGVYEAEIVNDGTEDAYVNYKIKLKKESGYVGIVSEYGAMQFGKYDEADGYIDRKNVVITSNQKGDFANWTDSNVFYENQRKIVTTQMTSDAAFGGRLGLMPSSFTTSGTAGAFSYGACKEYVLEAPVEQWYIWARAWFETGLVTQNGEWCLAVIDENNHLLAGMALEKNDRTRNEAYVRFLVGDGNGGSIVKKDIKFTPSYWIPPNPYGAQAIDRNSNMFDLVKEKDRVQFFWYGSYFPFPASQLNGKKAKRIQFYVGNYAGSNSSTQQFITHHYLNDFSFYELHVPYWKDVPNRYPAGSVIEIDGKKGEFKVNNQIRKDDEILGTMYFKVPPGTTKVQLNFSSFAEIESAKAIIEEVYI
ncbi:distal tail protein Dit [Streptococcus sp.]|uniref:distal tail protein Dit n=1 Tax=Streptococcus sp. TaxID=1306 RepID=UPI00208FF1BE|nr:distal tail protein Dit [Streptococcus sp.]